VAHWFYVLVKGEVGIRIRGASGEEKEVARSVAPNFFGEMGVMTGAARTATVVALSEVECYRIEKQDFHRIIRARPEMADQIAEILAQRQVSQQAVVENLGTDERESRIPAEHIRILAGIRVFFGLDSGASS
jgi:CRP-like cAMP-binding protein